MKAILILFTLFKMSLTEEIHIHYHFKRQRVRESARDVAISGCKSRCSRVIGGRRN